MKVLMMPDYRSGNPYQQLLADALRDRKVEVLFPRGYRRGLPLYRAWRSAGRPEVLHLHWIDPYLRGRNLVTQIAYCLRFVTDLALLKAAGASIAWTIHNRVSHECRWPRLELWVQRRLARRADQLIVHAQANLQELRQDLPLSESRVSVIPHGHYRSVYGNAVESRLARQELGLPASGRIYLYFGYLRPYKGLEHLIGAWQASGPMNAGDKLLIVGQAFDDGYQAQLISVAGTNAGITVHPAYVPAERVHLFFSAADIVVLPFQKVLTSGSLLLAMSYGKPVIAPRLGAIAEMLGEGVQLLYDPDDALGLRSALEASMTLPLEALQAAIATACDRLGWPHIADLTLHTYQRATAHGLPELAQHCV